MTTFLAVHRFLLSDANRSCCASSSPLDTNSKPRHHQGHFNFAEYEGFCTIRTSLQKSKEAKEKAKDALEAKVAKEVEARLKKKEREEDEVEAERTEKRKKAKTDDHVTVLQKVKNKREAKEKKQKKEVALNREAGSKG